MAVETEFFSENLNYFSQYNWITTNSYFSPLPQNQKMNMEMGYYCNNYYNNFNQGITSFPSSSCTNSTANFAEYCLPSSMAYDQPLESLLQKHNHEVDHYLLLQGEKLKEALNQQKRQQMMILANNYESKTMALLKEKEEALQKLSAKTRLLEDYLKKAESETEVWQSIAKKKEEMVIELNNMLLFAQQNNIINNNIINNNNNHYNNANNDNYCYNNVVNDDDDAESVCDCESMNKNNGCKWCKNGSLSVVLLPCKHLCCCKNCEPLLGFCPVCNSVKHGSMEIFFS